MPLALSGIRRCLSTGGVVHPDRVTGVFRRILTGLGWPEGLTGGPHPPRHPKADSRAHAFPKPMSAQGPANRDRTSVELVRLLCRDAMDRARAGGLDATVTDSVEGVISPVSWGLISRVTRLLLWHSTDCNMRGHLTGRVMLEVRISSARIEIAVEDDGWAVPTGDEPHVSALACLLKLFEGTISRQSDWATNRVAVVLPTSPLGVVRMRCQCGQGCDSRHGGTSR